MSRSILLLATFIVCSFGYGQKYIRPFVGSNLSGRILDSKNIARQDSLGRADKVHAYIRGGLDFLFEKTPGREFYFGLNYSETGFQRQRLNYQFQDTVHPDIGLIRDLSMAAEKNAFFTYHFKYIEIPFGVNFQYTPRKYNNIFTGWFNIGVTPSFLVEQKMKVFLQGFSIKGKNRYEFENTGYDAAQFNVTFQTGSRFDVKVNRKLWATFDGLFRIHLLNTASSPNETLRTLSFTANLGVRYEIGDY